MSEEDWSFCQAALLKHSRTFAIPIAQLPQGLRRTVTCAYLLCRIADTVEDTSAFTASIKERLQRSLLDVLEEGRSPTEFQNAVAELPGIDEAERELLLQLDRVLACFASCPPALVASSTACIGELIRGMCIYSRRNAGEDGVVCLESEADLERYCYFVAGTIGRLLTEAFISEAKCTGSGAVLRLRELAERFGAGLQMVNILRDISSDLTRGYCFIPRTVLAREGLVPADIERSERQQACRRALRPLFDAASQHLEAALAYTLLLPSSATEIRSFCLIPLCMAVETLALCREDDRLLERGYRVKLSRKRVVELVTECTAIVRDDVAIRARFASLSFARNPLPEPVPVLASER